MILLVITAIGILAASSLKINGLIEQFSLDRTAYYRKKAALDALGLYGIAWCYKKGDPSEQKPIPARMTFEQWPSAKSPYKGTVMLTAQKKQWEIVAQISNQAGAAESLKIEAGPAGNEWRIVSWQYLVK